MMSANENSPPVEAAAAASTPRSRLPRWTRHETLVLIQARRGLPLPVRPRPKWAAVSAYCRRHGVEPRAPELYFARGVDYLRDRAAPRHEGEVNDGSLLDRWRSRGG